MGLEHDPVNSETFLTFRKMVFLTEILLDSFVVLATAVTFSEYIKFFTYQDLTRQDRDFVYWCLLKHEFRYRSLVSSPNFNSWEVSLVVAAHKLIYWHPLSSPN
jgi:hypothetical protein